MRLTPRAAKVLALAGTMTACILRGQTIIVHHEGGTHLHLQDPQYGHNFLVAMRELGDGKLNQLAPNAIDFTGPELERNMKLLVSLCKEYAKYEARHRAEDEGRLDAVDRTFALLESPDKLLEELRDALDLALGSAEEKPDDQGRGS